MTMKRKEAEELIRSRFFEQCKEKELVPQYVLYSIGFTTEEADAFRKGKLIFHTTHLIAMHDLFGIDPEFLLKDITLETTTSKEESNDDSGKE